MKCFMVNEHSDHIIGPEDTHVNTLSGFSLDKQDWNPIIESYSSAPNADMLSGK